MGTHKWLHKKNPNLIRRLSLNLLRNILYSQRYKPHCQHHPQDKPSRLQGLLVELRTFWDLTSLLHFGITAEAFVRDCKQYYSAVLSNYRVRVHIGINKNPPTTLWKLAPDSLWCLKEALSPVCLILTKNKKSKPMSYPFSHSYPRLFWVCSAL